MNSSSGAESAAREAARPDGPRSAGMVERVARVLSERRGTNPDAPWLGSGPPGWTVYADDARAAIAAMREPTEGMLIAGRCAAKVASAKVRPAPPTRDELAASFTAMIDAALNPTSGEGF